ncbi:MAG: hypothetical protein K0S44_235 [Bacteroidetes bacterium]|jgi:hypothetical protein|nr:hypothetical protein [Bacteroidota bacterium]
MKNYFIKLWMRFNWHLKELNKTLSNQPSHYSSKRFERMIIFVNACVMLDLIVWKLMQEDKIDYIAAIALYTAQMVYAGYQTKQIFKDKQNDTPVDGEQKV